MKQKEEEFHLSFDDHTLLEADGEYDAVMQLMLDEELPAGDWMLQTKLVLASMAGVAEFVLNFYNDKSIIIQDYKPSQHDVFYNTDLAVLMTWAQEAGWEIPSPHPDLIKSKYSFWHHFWDSGIVESKYLDELCGWRNKCNEE